MHIQDPFREKEAVHWVWWAYLVILSLVICLVGEPIPVIGDFGPAQFAPVAWSLAAGAAFLLTLAYVRGDGLITAFVFVMGAFYIWRGVSLFYSDDPYREVRVFTHAGHLLSLALTHMTYGLLRADRGR